MKRCNNFENINGKKCKVDDDLDDFWGDDPDIDDLDDCLLLATQACENQASKLNNVSILPNYDAFIKPSNKDIFSSTMAGPSTQINGHTINNKNENEKLGLLQGKLLAKDGEIAILRSQMKQMKDSLDGELSRKQTYYEEQLKTTKKDYVKISAELEFKDLEIANLKRKLVNTISMGGSKFKVSQVSMAKIEMEVAATEEKEQTTVYIDPIIVPEYPLKNLITPDIFNSPITDSGALRLNKCMNDVDILHNLKFSKSKYLLKEKPIKMNNGKALSLQYVFPEISHFMKSEKLDLDSADNIVHINKIISVGLQFLSNFHLYLTNYESCTKEETIMQSDVEFLNDKISPFQAFPSLFDSSNWTLDECGIQCRQIITLMAVILPFNAYLRGYLIDETPIKFSGNEEYLTCLNCLTAPNKSNDSVNFLNTILSIIAIIGRIRLAPYCVGFLSAVCRLLEIICETSFRLPAQVYLVIGKITKELVLTRPNLTLIYYLSKYLKTASHHKEIIAGLCNMQAKSSLKRNKKGIVLINHDCCTFQIFGILYRQNLQDNGWSDKYYERHLYILEFVWNAFNSNAPWLYCQENKHYDCLSEINKLSVEVIYVVLKDSDGEKYSDVIKNVLKLSSKILHVINFKSYQLIERNINFHSKYKAIKNMLIKNTTITLREYDADALEKTCDNISDQITNLNILKFNEIPLWSE